MMSASDTVPVTWEPDKLLALALSQPSEALAAARTVLAGNPSAAEAAVAHQAVGVVLRHFGDISEAIERTEARASFRPQGRDPARESDILASLGVALLLAGQTRQACPSSTRLLQKEP